uniref:Uncharacterized protein n=1 Tax=Meloidogyne incognita TaxID=6306 RepID=A0A914MVH2_MELIC
MFNLLSPHRYNDDLIKYYSLWLAYNICQKLLTKSVLNNIRAIHLFNSNQWEMTRSLLVKLGFLLKINTKEYQFFHSFILLLSKFHTKIQSDLSTNISILL